MNTYYNHDTRKNEPMPEVITDEVAISMIAIMPGDGQGAGRNMYRLLRHPDFKNMSIEDALIKVLSAQAGDKS